VAHHHDSLERRSRKPDVGSQSADTIKLSFRFRQPRRCARSQGSGTRPRKCLLSTSWKETAAADGVAAKIQTETIRKIGSRFPFRVQEPAFLKRSSEANRTLEFANPRPHRLGKCDSEQASAEQDKTGNRHSQETVGNEFFAHGTPPTARKIDCDARKSQLPRRHQGYLRVLYRQLISSFGAP
jgi:hypothetical protein